MNSQEAAMLCRYVRALCPQQKFDEYSPDAWHDILGSYALTDAREAAARVARRQPFVAPSEIADEISKIRAERTHNFVYEPPTGESDPDYLKRLRRQLAATGDGQRPPAVEKTLTARPVAELLAAIGRDIPGPDVAKVRRPGPLGRECPNCHAAIGRPCHTPSGNERAPHTARRGQSSSPEAEAAEIERRRAASAAALARLTEQETTP
jgi:hypothetical protein